MKGDTKGEKQVHNKGEKGKKEKKLKKPENEKTM